MYAIQRTPTTNRPTLPTGIRLLKKAIPVLKERRAQPEQLVPPVRKDLRVRLVQPDQPAPPAPPVRKVQPVHRDRKATPVHRDRKGQTTTTVGVRHYHQQMRLVACVWTATATFGIATLAATQLES